MVRSCLFCKDWLRGSYRGTCHLYGAPTCGLVSSANFGHPCTCLGYLVDSTLQLTMEILPPCLEWSYRNCLSKNFIIFYFSPHIYFDFHQYHLKFNNQNLNSCSWDLDFLRWNHRRIRFRCCIHLHHCFMIFRFAYWEHFFYLFEKLKPTKLGSPSA